MKFISVHYELIPLTELSIPKDRHVVILNSYWAVDKDDNALIYIRNGAYSPQCNDNRKITECLRPKGTKCVFVPVAYVNSKYITERFK